MDPNLLYLDQFQQSQKKVATRRVIALEKIVNNDDVLNLLKELHFDGKDNIELYYELLTIYTEMENFEEFKSFVVKMKSEIERKTKIGELYPHFGIFFHSAFDADKRIESTKHDILAMKKVPIDIDKCKNRYMCDSKRGYYTALQQRSADEAATLHFECYKCGYKWKF